MEVLPDYGIQALCWRMKPGNWSLDSVCFSGPSRCGSGAGKLPALPAWPAPLRRAYRCKGFLSVKWVSRDLETNALDDIRPSTGNF